MAMLTLIADSLFRTEDSIATPCSVKAYGKYCRPPLVSVFVVAICDRKIVYLFLMAATAAAKRADGTLYGLHDT